LGFCLNKNGHRPHEFFLKLRPARPGARVLSGGRGVVDPGSPEGMQRLYARLAAEREKAAEKARRMRQMVEEIKQGA